MFRYHEKMIFKKLERYSPRFHNSELGKKIKGTPSIFSPGCKDFVLQYVDKAQNFEKRDIFANWQFLFNISDMFYANNDDILLIYFFQFLSYSLAPMPLYDGHKNFCRCQKTFVFIKEILSSSKIFFVIIKKNCCHCSKNILSLSKQF